MLETVQAQSGAPAKQIAWNLNDLYPSLAAWQSERDALSSEIKGLAKFKGTLAKDAASVALALDSMSAIYKRYTRAQIYASLKSDEDVRVSENRARTQGMQTLGTELQQAISWLRPEVLSIGAEKIEAYIRAEPKLAKHAFYLRDILRNKPHTLSLEAEQLLAQASNALGQPGNIYSILADGDLPYPKFRLKDGTEVTLNQAAYSKHRQSADRPERKRVFDTFWGAWKTYEGTFGASLNAEILSTVFQAKARNFKSSLSAQLFSSNLPEPVYRTLVSEVNKSLPTFHRYLKIRARMLGVSDLGYHDIYAPLTQVAGAYGVEESKTITLAALASLGEQYASDLKKGFEGGWMHVYPQPGKSSGAYMSGGAYDVHPYILLNHNDDYDSLTTFAHEWGHAIHSVMANRAQPYELADYSTFTAETAAITNEMFLQDHLLKGAKTRDQKLAFLNEALDAVRGSYFRQTMFAEFQLAAHEMAEKGETLTGEKLTALYCGLLKRYHGHDQGVMKIDPAYCVEWAFIPHFYNGFYVFQYATSIAGAAYFADAIVKEGAPARDRYLAMLSAGGSDFAYELYKKAGADMAKPDPYRALDARINRIMDEMETLLAQK